jgi:hypothetical protein
MNTHTGKIGRLDSSFRHELGVRLENGEPNKSLVEWLNSIPEVQATLKRSFDSRPITEQNLSEWKQHGGHQQWVRLQETRELARQLTEDAEVLESDTEGDPLSDKLAVMMAAELGRLMAALVAEEKDPEKRWQRLKEMHRELSQLRRDDHRAMRLRWDRKQREKEENAALDAETRRLEQEHKSKLLNQIMAPLENKTMGKMLGLMGYGENGEKVAELAHLIKTDGPWRKFMDDMSKDEPKNGKKTGSKAVDSQGHPSKSNQIQPTKN